ncbi:bacterial bifunctional deaminase-reductase [Sporormia fimetaria CBS 119925]|uniref:2,5-diamino-6-ribosylamino-4(3H)-pyrimidinone 5'-phosphate reductase n=1 Tax=Sporormia fimetaria CBS 119925 TaxID=1340428 RepID=A0A6A6VIV9_9PLEO|nr:bacterial bifunctional deaminase-reductase [Sporormia fimetaria CBS 119925]
MASRGALVFLQPSRLPLDPYLPPASTSQQQQPPPKPHLTLTFATSLDSNLSLSPGVQTVLSGPESKAMTHYLRSKHDAILIGVGTAIADNPSLNCRIDGVGGYGGEGLEGQPRPVVLDPKGRWEFGPESKCIALAREERGKAPWLIVARECEEGKRKMLESVGGRVLQLPASEQESGRYAMDWREIMVCLAEQGVRSVMVEGGGSVINELLSPKYFDLVGSVIVTIAPTWLGKDGVQVCPDAREEGGKRIPVSRLRDVKWIPLGEDVVLCGRPNGN